MAETTARHALPLIQVGQSQKELTHNEALHQLDTLVHLAVASRSVADPPPAPAPGMLWIVPEAATGAWAAQTDRLAEWDGSGWRFSGPVEGTLCWVADAAVLAVFGGGKWNTDFLPVGGLSIGNANMFGAARINVPEPFGGTMIDIEARAAIGQLISYLRAQGLLTG